MNKANWEKFRENIIDHPVPDLEGKMLEDIDASLRSFHTNIQEAMIKYIPKTSYKTLPHIRTTDKIRLIQTQYNQLHKYIQNFGPNIYSIQRIKQLRQQLTTSFQTKRTEQWNQLVRNINASKDPKNFWKQINQMKGRKNINIPYIIDSNGSKIYGELEKEKAFRNTWSKVFKISEEENENFDQDHEESIRAWMTNHIDQTTPYETVSKNRIQPSDRITEGELLHNLRKFAEKTPGHSGITRSILMNLPQQGIDTLLEIFNASIATGYFPDELKKTKMIFIPKEGKDTKHIINYRPISLLEVTGKLFEKIINDRLLLHMETNNIINKKQHGFRRSRGTQTALAVITESIAQSKAKKQNVNLILRDIKKAFDKVWHLGLKYKILRTDPPEYMKRILCDYLEDREIQIQIGNFLGPAFTIESGVPQGGCLSPTLFILYTSDMPEPAPYSDHVMFADDVTQIVSYPGKSKELLSRHTAKAIENINRYEKKWKIQTSTNKFKVIPVGRTNSAPLIVDEDILPYTREGTVLGLKITSNGYKQFISEKINRLRVILTKLKGLYQLTINNKKKLYLTLVRSILEYPPIPLHAINITNMYELQKIQNQALRYIYNVRYPEIVTIDELHERSGIPRIKELLEGRAKEIWQKIDNLNIDSTLHDFNDFDITPHKWFPLSKPNIT